MSIIKNRRNTNREQYTDVTVRTLPKGVSVPLGNSGLSCVFAKYVQLNNKYYNAPWKLGAGETIYIKAEIEQNATGYIYGHNRNNTSANGGHSIRKNGANIEWLNGNTVVATKPWEAGVHIYGFAGVMGDTTGCKPSYDGVVISDTIIRGGGYAGDNAIICGAMIGTSSMSYNYITSTGSWAIRVYEVYAYSYSIYRSGYRTPRIYHMYATSGGSLAETRFELRLYVTQSGTSVSGVTASESVADFDGMGYGVQLEDLRTITGSPYTQLVAILADDEPLKALPEADSPYKINGKDFAFRIDTIPSGATHSGGENVMHDGGLIRGRRPKWDIWNDAIKFGLHVETEPNTGNKRMRFNIFKDNFGNPTKDMLAVFDGYSQASDASHEPKLVSASSLKIHTHNGAFCRCYSDDVMAGTLNSQNPGTSNLVGDSDVVFTLNTNVGGNVNIVAGNLLPWNYTRDEWQAGLQDDIYGVVAKLTYVGGMSMLVNAKSYESTPLCKDSTDTIKDKYRVSGFSAPLQINGNYAVSMLDYIEQHQGLINLKANLSLMTQPTDNPTEAQLINCDYFQSSSDVTASVVSDEKIVDTSTKYRMVVDSHTSSPIGVVFTNEGILGNLMRTKYGYNNNNTDIIYLPFLGMSGNNPVWSSKSYIAFPEIYWNKSTALNEFHYEWGRYASLTYDNLGTKFPSALDGMSSRTLQNEWWFPSGSPSQSSTFNDPKNFQIRNGSIGGTIAKSETSKSNLRNYTRFIAFDTADYGFNTQYRIEDNATVIMHIYDASTAPIACGFKNAYFSQYSHAPNFHINWNGDSYVIMNPIPVRFVDNAADAKILAFVYVKNGDIYELDEIPDCSVDVYVNNNKVGTASIDYMEDFYNRHRNTATYNIGNYILEVMNDASLPDGYYFRGLDHLYDGGGTCYQFRLLNSSGGTASLSHGDSFSIEIR